MKNLTAALKKISEIIKKSVDIIERNGYIAYSSDDSKTGTVVENAEKGQIVSIDGREKYFVHIKDGSAEEVNLVQLILKDKISEGTADNYQQFLINILDGISLSEEDGRKFNINCNDNYIIYCINLLSKEHFHDVYSLVLNSFYGSKNKWVFAYGYQILLLESIDEFSEGIESNANVIKDMVNSEIYTDIHIGIGNIHNGIKSIKESLREAEEAIRIGKIFNLPDYIYIYKDILPERIISLIPQDRIKGLVHEVLSEGIDDILDGEMKKTIEVMFRNNLNISDSSKELYIHRNTLLYRIDKIQKAADLDIRRFEDAVIFKLVLLLRSRME